MAKSTYGNGYLRPRGKKWYGYIRIIVKDSETGERVTDRISVMGSVKDVQGLLRHEKPTISAEVYMQEIPETVRKTVNSIHKELRKRRPVPSPKRRIVRTA